MNQALSPRETEVVAGVLAVFAAATLAMYAWVLVQIRHARAAVRDSLSQTGIDVVRMEYRPFRQGPFFWTTSRTQHVFRLLVRDTNGRARTGWARWGRAWLFSRNVLEFRWDSTC